MKNLKTISRSEGLQRISIRKGEKKLGEEVHFSGDYASIENWPDKIRFVLIGIPEDIGPRANGGRAGSQEMWEVFLSKFLNIQSNRFLNGSEIMIAGEVDCEEWKNKSDLSTEQLRSEVEALDHKVVSVLKPIFAKGYLPIVIGGGHNNAYPIIKSWFEAKQQTISIINVDPHSDIRPQEGRHSGNGFSYAMHEHLISTYAVAGLHESYNSEYLLQQLDQNSNMSYFTYDAWLRGEFVLEERLLELIRFGGNGFRGLEFDLDSVAGFPSSAMTESGFSVETARKMIMYIGKNVDLAYAHFPEGAPCHSKEDAGIHGKTLSYMVSDLMKVINNKP